MKPSFLIFILLPLFGFSFGSEKPYSIGLRLGEPMGITLQKHTNQNTWEINIASSILKEENAYYKRFENFCKDRHPFSTNFEYLDYGTSPRLSISGHYFLETRMPEVNNLFLYYGAGLQFRFHNYYYRYRYVIYGETDWIEPIKKNIPDFDFGTDLILGINYKPHDSRYIIYCEANVFIEFVDNPILGWGQAGLGVRYLFDY